jgi:hypothetical protein
MNEKLLYKYSSLDELIAVLSMKWSHMSLVLLPQYLTDKKGRLPRNQPKIVTRR